MVSKEITVELYDIMSSCYLLHKKYNETASLVKWTQRLPGLPVWTKYCWAFSSFFENVSVVARCLE